MLVRFLRDYRGKLTEERFYLSGDEVELSDGVATTLVNRQVVELVAPVEDVPASQPKTRRGRKAKGE